MQFLLIIKFQTVLQSKAEIYCLLISFKILYIYEIKLYFSNLFQEILLSSSVGLVTKFSQYFFVLLDCECNFC